MRFVCATSPRYRHLMAGCRLQWARYMPWPLLEFETEDANWSGSLFRYLSTLPDPYIGFLLDDYWMVHAPHMPSIVKLTGDIPRADKIDYQGQVGYWPHQVEDGICVADQNAPYRTSTQLAVWRRQYLMGLLHTGGPSPWQFELQGYAANDGRRIIGLLEAPCAYANIMLKGKVMQYELDRLLPADLQDLRDRGALVGVAP